jgi:hypothetical protein
LGAKRCFLFKNQNRKCATDLEGKTLNYGNKARRRRRKRKRE